MTDTAILIQKRGRFKGVVTRVKAFAEAIQPTATLEELTTRLNKIEEAWVGFGEIEDHLLSTPGQTSELEEFEGKYYDTKALLMRAIKDRSPPRTEQLIPSHPDLHSTFNNTVSTEQLSATINSMLQSQQSFFENFNRTRQSQSSQISADLRLPRINIPNFSGDYKQWPSFQDLFETTVDKNESLNPCQKLQYLKGLLKDEAAALIRHLAITDSNYQEAWCKLKERYDKKRHITVAMIKTFLEQNTVSQPSSKQLRSMHDAFHQVIRGLRALGPNAEARDPWLILIALNKLDSETRELWSRRCDSLEACISISKRAPATKILHVTSSTKTQSCLTCKGSHYLYQCPDLKAKPVFERKSFVVSNSLCFNCLQTGHSVKSCRSKHRCFHCKRIHHSLLHDTAAISHQSTDSLCNNSHNNNQQTLHLNQDSTSSINPNQTTSTNQSLSSFNTNVIVDPYSSKSLQTCTGLSTVSLLPTALVNTPDINGKLCSCRILLDSGSQVSFISETCVKRLALKRSHSRLSISGISETNTGFTRGKINIHLFSRVNPSEGINVEVHIMSKLTSLIPAVSFTTDNLSNIQKHPLADPYFNKPDKFFAIFKKDRSLRQFWESEDLHSSKPFLTEEEANSEKHFKKHTYRDTTGRFVVSLPFKEEVPNLGFSEGNAIKRLHSIEQQFKRDESYKNQYISFIAEYMKLGHMERIPDNEIKSPPEKCFYLPHHAVFKGYPDAKIRVVFDGSCKTSSGMSLNDCLLIGPTIQRDLFSILINFRKHPVAITGDIEKMYRQILINPNDRNYQRIVWRKDTTDPIQHYRLTTVTYGTSAASFLATRALMRVAENYRESLPAIAAVIENDFYVDDVLTGAGSAIEALELQTILRNILQKNGFNLTKWRSNCTKLMENSSEEQYPLIITDKPECIKILGIEWDNIQYTFFFKTLQLSNDPPTKRRILSESSRIFDPLGWLSPVVISIKILFQQLWVQQLDWDDSIPQNIVEKWNNFKANLPAISKIHIPRLICKYNNDIQLHGFCDASELAYGAVVYCRTTNSKGEIFVSLVAAKTKVAPLKQISLPRLELCGAHLLSKLMPKISQSLDNGHITMHAWTDSSIVLSWLSDIPRRWKTYVANRTAEILDSIPRNCWKHISSPDNPADCASRGMSPAKLPTFDLWWQGPSWLKLDMAA